MKTPILLTTLLAASSALAGSASVSSTDTASESNDLLTSLWDLPTIYKGDGFLREARFIGRLHADVYEIDSAQGHQQDWELRRFRVGTRLKFAGGLEFKTEVQLNPQASDPAYERISELYLSWKQSESFNLKIGKFAADFTHDGRISSNNLQTLERNQLTNSFWATTRFFSGVAANGQLGKWSYNVGVFSNDVDKEFGNFDASWFGVLGLGYDISAPLGAKKAVINLDYFYQDVDPAAVNIRPFEHVGSLNLNADYGSWGFATDLAGGIGKLSQSDGWGAMGQVWYQFTDKLEGIARYTHVEGSDPDSLRFGRYESRIVSGKGDRYDEAYLGLNYYIYGHKLKLQSGWTYASMDDSAGNGGEYDGWAWTTGLRMSW